MDRSALFSAPESKSLGFSIIAALIYDAGPLVDHQHIRDLGLTCVSAACGRTVKSVRTHKKILKQFELKDVRKATISFRQNGKPVDPQFFVKRFAKAISKRNAQKLAPIFVKTFWDVICENEQLFADILKTFAPAISCGNWDLPPDILSEFERLSAEVAAANNATEASDLSAVADELVDGALDEQEDHSSSDDEVDATAADVQAVPDFPTYARVHDAEIDTTPALKNTNSGQLPSWNASTQVLPLRGIRKIESCLMDSALLHITGAQGSGKTTLLAAYLDSIQSSSDDEAGGIFYYRFRDGLSDYYSFVDSLASFLFRNGAGVEASLISKNIPAFISRVPVRILLDDIHEIQEEAITQLILEIWQKIGRTNSYPGKLIVCGRELFTELLPDERQYVHYNGLSTAESSALVRDKWQLSIAKPMARSLVEKLQGNAHLLILFRDWWIGENHTDTELERFTNQIPGETHEIYEFLAEHVYDVLERQDERLNNLLKCASVFRMPETEEFCAEVYRKVSGGEFQENLETLVEKYSLINYDGNLNRYELRDGLRDYYYEKINSKQTWRILHYSAAHLYEERYQSRQDMIDSLESAHHFLKADREEQTVRLVEKLLTNSPVNGNGSRHVLGILTDLDMHYIDSRDLRADVLFNRGKLYQQLGDFEKAEKDLLECEALEVEHPMLSAIHYTRGLIARAGNRVVDALELFQDALEGYYSVADTQGIAKSSLQIAELYILNDEIAQAQALLEEHREAFAELDDYASVQRAYSYLGNLYRDQGRLEDADQLFENVLELSARLGDDESLADSLNNLAFIREQNAEWDQAINHYHEELQIREKMTDWIAAAHTYQRIGEINFQRGELDPALGYYRSAHALFEKYEHAGGLAVINSRIGHVFMANGKNDDALNYFEASLDIFEHEGNLDGIGDAYRNIATIFKAREEWEQALDMFERSLEIKERLGDETGIAHMYEMIGDIYSIRQEHDHAMEVYRQCITMKGKIGDQAGIAKMHFNIGRLYYEVGDLTNAIDAYKSSLTIMENIEYLDGVARCYHSLALCYKGIEDLDTTLEYYERAAAAFQMLDNAVGQGDCLFNLGQLCHDSGDWQRAQENYSQALPFFEKVSDLEGVAKTLGNLSSIEFEQHDYDTAIFRQLEILLYFKTLEENEKVERVLANLVACHQELGPDVFQPILNRCLEAISGDGVYWGENEVLPGDIAKETVEAIFFAEKAK